MLGNLFHPQHPQQARYTTDQNHLKGLQTAGGNKFVMSDAKGAQTILISNSNNKGTAVEVGFAGDGSVHIQSNGPVTVNGSVITPGAGVPGKGQTAYTGEIVMRAKKITMTTEEEVTVESLNKTVVLTAKTDLTATAEQALQLTSTGTGVTVSGGPSVDIKAGKVKVNS
jgi:type VI secretion system secreted protein VgrG